MVASATYGPYDGLAQYMKLRLRADRRGRRSGSKTLEYAFDDWTIARMARRDGPHRRSQRRFDKRAANWKHAFDPATGFMRARKRDGQFREPFDPRTPAATAATTPRATPGSTPGTCRRTSRAWSRADGRRRSASSRSSTQLFDAKVEPKTFAHIEDITGLIGQYAHGNEPSHHIAYLYAYAGQPGARRSGCTRSWRR